MCFNPIILAKDKIVKCGKCFECKQQEAKAWATRIMLEAENYSHSPYLITLTYNDNCLTYQKDKLLRDITLFIKKLRKSYGKLRYFYCMEYGSLHQRPHFHMILFGLPLDDLLFLKRTKKNEVIYRSKMIEDKWKRDGKSIGFSSVGIMDDLSEAKYVTLYMQKGKSDLQGFRRMSKSPAIGALNLENRLDWLKTGKFVLRGKSYSLPKVFLNAFRKLGYVREVVRLNVQRYTYWLKSSQNFSLELVNKKFYCDRFIKVNKLKKCNIFLDNNFCLC